MALDEVGTVVVLRCSFTSIADAFERDSEAHIEAGWDMFVGANEARFAARAQPDATLVMPRLGFESDLDLAVHLREILGDALDAHDDDRGIAWLSEAPAEDDATYDALVDGDHAWVEKLAKDDPRLEKASGWMFGAAAKGLKTDAKVVARVEASAAADPMHQAGEKLDDKAEKREDRSSLRRSLGAAVGSSFLDSPLAKQAPDKPDASDLGKKPSGLADTLTRDAAGDKAAELTSSLRDAVEGDVAAAVGDLDASKPPESSDE